MGCKLSVVGDAAARATNREIESSLKKAHSSEKSVIKILLLGTGEAGKSTIIKQMKIIHNNGFESDELREGARILHGLLFRALEKASSSSSVVSIEKKSEIQTASSDLKLLQEATEPATELTQAHYEAFHRILSLEGMKDSLIPRDDHLSLSYFVAQADRIMRPEYIPTAEDFLRLRQRTSGIMEYLFKVKCEITKGYPTVMTFRMIDVGGQRNERRKWIHCFEGVQCVLFIVSLAEYDQVLEEDSVTNRLQESLILFQNIFHNKFFSKSGFILFLNKTDLFEEKIRRTPLGPSSFPELPGELKLSVQEAKEFILSKFLERTASEIHEQQKRRPSRAVSSKALYHHFTTATDTQHIKYIFSSVTEMIIRTTLERTQLI